MGSWLFSWSSKWSVSSILFSTHNQLASELPKKIKEKNPNFLRQFIFERYIWAKKIHFKPLEIQKYGP